MAKVEFKNGVVEEFTVILSTRNHKHHGQLTNITNMSYNAKLNAADEISFTVTKSANPTEEEKQMLDLLVDLKLIYVPQIYRPQANSYGEYFEITVAPTDGNDQTIEVVGTSCCEAELSQKTIYGLEVNTEDDIAREDYDEDYPTVFFRDLSDHTPGDGMYEKLKDSSLLHRIMSYKPGYTIRHVDTSLWDVQRMFSVDGTDIYSFLTGDVSEQFNCLFLFDSVDRAIDVYDLDTYGKDTTILVDKENLIETAKATVDVGSVKNSFKLKAGDDIMTAAVVNLNPNGSDTIYYISEEQRADMSNELVKKLDEYDKLYTSKLTEYENLTKQLYDSIEEISKLEHTMMPDVTTTYGATNIEEAIKEVNAKNLSPTCVNNENYLNKASIELAISSYARVYVNTSKFNITVKTNSITGSGNTRTWNGNITLTEFSDKDSTRTVTLTLTIDGDHNHYDQFLEQKIFKNICTIDNRKEGVFDVLNNIGTSEFPNYLTYYSQARLKSFYESINAALGILQDANQGAENAEYYSSFYNKYYTALNQVAAEINNRGNQIDSATKNYDSIDSKRVAINKELNFKDFLGEKLYNEFSYYEREQTYTNSNFISDDLTNTELFDKAKEFFKKAQEELYKSATRQITVSCDNLSNLLAIKEFTPIRENFELGNWIRVRVGDVLYKLRLISYGIDFDNNQTISVDFSDVTKLKDGVSDVKSILDQAQSMASSYSYIELQSEKGNKAENTLQKMREEGLNSALVKVKNANTEDVIIDQSGITLRSWDDLRQLYSPEQAKLIHNNFVFTKDSWKTAVTALGKQTYTLNGVTREEYGLNSDFVISGKIIAGDIYSANYSSSGKGTHFDLSNGNFSIADGKLVYNSKTNKLNLSGVTLDWNTTTSPSISDVTGLASALSSVNGNIDALKTSVGALDGRIQSFSQADDPSTNWDTQAKSDHTDDLWFNPNDGLTKRWTGAEWDTITDSGLKELASRKATIFTSQPTPPYQIGDLWVQGSGGDILKCVNAKPLESDNYAVTDWDNASKYTDDTVANAANKIANEAKNAGDALAAQLGRTQIGDTFVFSPSIVGGSVSIASVDGTTSASISNNGVLTATGANISGTITATSGSFTGSIYASGGTIGGWTINQDSLNGNGTISGGTISGSTINNGNGTFYVDANGNMVAGSASITGAITSTSFVGYGTNQYVKTTIYNGIIVDNTSASINAGISLKGAIYENGSLAILPNLISFYGGNNFNGDNCDLSVDSRGLYVTNALVSDKSFHVTSNENGLYHDTHGWLIRHHAQTYTDGGKSITVQSTAVGNSSHQLRLWASGAIYKNGGTETIQTSGSDARIKENIVSLDKYESIYPKLKPVAFNYKEGLDQPRRTIWGYVAQDTEKAFNDADISLDNEDVVFKSCPNELEKKYIDDDISYKMNYQNFIALNTHMIQKTRKELSSLQEENQQLKSELSEIKQLLTKLTTETV